MPVHQTLSGLLGEAARFHGHLCPGQVLGARVPCDGCGEDVNYRRETVVITPVLCRPCAGEGYYRAS